VYTENVGKDVYIFTRAFLTNQIAIFTPKLYLRLTNETGRNDEDAEDEVSVQETADYFMSCLQDYQEQMGLKQEDFRDYLKDKIILEYGPGDIFGMAFLLYAYGAERVRCVDRFPLFNLSNRNVEIYKQLMKSMDVKARERANNAFNEKGKPKSGFKPNTIDYRVTKDGLCGEKKTYDLIISRAVLEHVESIEDTMFDIKQALKEDGISLHKVDLRSHDLDRYINFDFLTWSNFVYKLMYSHKGYPNRWRVNKYKDCATLLKLNIVNLAPTEQLTEEQVNLVYPKLARDFRSVSPEELSWMSFWMTIVHEK
jgi:SAM-dependent methyltransferase